MEPDGGLTPKSPPPRKNRKLNRTEPSLKRNAACVSCRRRRVRCDGQQPCAACLKSFNFLARTQQDKERQSQGIRCWYEDKDESEEGSERSDIARVRSGDVSAAESPERKLSRLQARIHHLEAALSHSGSVPPPAASSSLGFSPGPISPTRPTASTSQSPNVSDRLPFDSMSSHMDWRAQVAYGSGSGTGAPSSSSHSGGLQLVEGTAEQTDQGDPGSLGGASIETLWPGWPPNLPAPALLNSLIYTFFTRAPTVNNLIDHRALFRRLNLPPRDSNFPHPALLHALCTIAAIHSDAVTTWTVEKRLEQTRLAADAAMKDVTALELLGGTAARTCFAEAHCTHAENQMIRYDIVCGQRLYEQLQAQALLFHFYAYAARWMDAWMCMARMSRLCIMLGLTHHPTGGSNFLLPPPVDEFALEERRSLLSYIICCDTFLSGLDHLPPAFAIVDIHVLLPAGRADVARGAGIPLNPQTYADHDVFSSHPVVDSVIMKIKGMLVMAYTSRFTRIARAMPRPAQLTLSVGPAFTEINTRIDCLLTSWPPSLRNPLEARMPADGRIDPDLVWALIAVHTARIRLYEPFVDSNHPESHYAQVVLGDARSCIRTLSSVTSSGEDLLSALSPGVDLWLMPAARTILLFYDRTLANGDANTSLQLSLDLQTLITSLSLLSRVSVTANHTVWLVRTVLRAVHEDHSRPPSASWAESRRFSHQSRSSSPTTSQHPLRTSEAPMVQPRGGAEHLDSLHWYEERGKGKTCQAIIDGWRGWVLREQESPPTTAIDKGKARETTAASLEAVLPRSGTTLPDVGQSPYNAQVALGAYAQVRTSPSGSKARGTTRSPESSSTGPPPWQRGNEQVGGGALVPHDHEALRGVDEDDPMIAGIKREQYESGWADVEGWMREVDRYGWRGHEDT